MCEIKVLENKDFIVQQLIGYDNLLFRTWKENISSSN